MSNIVVVTKGVDKSYIVTREIRHHANSDAIIARDEDGLGVYCTAPPMYFYDVKDNKINWNLCKNSTIDELNTDEVLIDRYLSRDIKDALIRNSVIENLDKCYPEMGGGYCDVYKVLIPRTISISNSDR